MNCDVDYVNKPEKYKCLGNTIDGNILYPTVTSARSCNNVGHLFWFTILAQHETNDVILYIHSVHKHRRNTFQRQNYKMRLKRFRSPSFGPPKTITTWLTKTEIFTLHWINIIIRNNKCIFNKLNEYILTMQMWFNRRSVWDALYVTFS
jgi:hypothetical protein